MKVLPVLTACMLPLLSVAEFVVPIESVEEFVNVRMVPDPKSEIVGKLYQGDSAKIVKSTPQWHEIEIAGGATGFISAEWTNVVDEWPPTAKPAAKTQRPAKVNAGNASANAHPESAGEDPNKENVLGLTVEEAMAALANLEPVTFNYTQHDDARHVGFTAGNVPELVASSESEGLKPLEIVAVLTRVVKMQQDRIAELESRLAERN